MEIRYIDNKDSNEIYKWRNDILTREMSFNKKIISPDEHDKWFKKSMNNSNRIILIGEIQNTKLGLCRFDFNQKLNIAEVSININPKYRGKGYGKALLKKSIQFYLNKKNCVLKAQIKLNNIISKKLFLSVGFNITKERDDGLEMKFIRKLNFIKVDESDVHILYELLKNRNHNISHKILPEFEIHKKFVESDPYLHWYKFTLRGELIGTFYIQENNSIGINSKIIDRATVTEILDFIFANFSPKDSIPSKVPDYFYINVSETNNDLKNIIESLDYIKFQVSYKLIN